ncbi:hypothetical protein K8P03_08455 [Anaerococcus murdochii]|uniref:Uncharacterized protein n=2 Tax=Anaerococcus murdochii TaxID=411577 RepID=A0ABS7T0J2_9FIRM|nr:hypothetical protein [Anaerococcus murdochii]
MLNPMTVNASADSQIMVKEVKDKAEIDDLAKNKSNNGSWYMLNKDGETKYFYITDNGEVEIHDKDPNQEASDKYGSLEKGNVNIKVGGQKEYQSLLVNLKTKTGEHLPIDLNESEIKAVIPVGEYEIDSVSIVDKNGYMKDTKYDVDKQYFTVEKNKDYNLDLKINEVIDVSDKSIDDLVGEEKEDKEMTADKNNTSDNEESTNIVEDKKIDKSNNSILKYITTGVAALILAFISFLILRKKEIKGDYDD